MATSGSVDFELNASQIIKMALFNVGVIPPNGSPTANQTSNAMDMLNLLVKSWHEEGMPLWALKIGYLLPITGTNSMAINSHCVNSYAQTTVATAATSGATSIVVGSISGIADSDQVGFEIDDGTMHWTTVSSSSSATITVATALDGPAGVGNTVYYYTGTTDNISRPERIYHMVVNDVISGITTPGDVITYDEYIRLSKKSAEGLPLQLHYDPQLGNNATFYWWPRHENGDRVMQIRYRRPFEDFDTSGSDTPDFPSSWNLALVWGLSALLAPGYGIPLSERKSFWEEAMKLKQEQQMALQEEASVFVQPQRTREDTDTY